MIVENFMTRRVATVTPDAPILEAARLMLVHRVSGLPVIDATGRVVGIVSEHDLLRHRDGGDEKQPAHWLQLMIEHPEKVGELAQFQNRKVSEVMTKNPITVAPATSLGEACRLIEDGGIKRLPVVQDGKLVGVIARADLVRALARAVERRPAAATADTSVEERLRSLERQIWSDRARVVRPF